MVYHVSLHYMGESPYSGVGQISDCISQCVTAVSFSYDAAAREEALRSKLERDARNVQLIEAEKQRSKLAREKLAADA